MLKSVNAIAVSFNQLVLFIIRIVVSFQMKLKSSIVVSFLIFMGFASYSQKNLTKTIIDSKTKLPIEYVFVSSNDRTLNLVSNKEGQFILINSPKIQSYIFFKIGYFKQAISTDDLLKLDTIVLEAKPFNLQEVTITSQAIDTIVKDKRYYVDDYMVLPNHDFLILTSKLNAKEFEVCYYKKNVGITCSKKIKNEQNGSLFLDCFKNIHVLTDNYSRQVLFSSDSTFDFLPRYTKSKFDSTLAQVVLNIDTQVVIKSFLPTIKVDMAFYGHSLYSPFLHYILVSKRQRKSLCVVFYNKSIQEMAKAEYFDQALRDTAFSKVGSRVNSVYSNECESNLFHSRVAKSIYAPIFSKNDTIIVFDFQEKTIAFFNRNGDFIKEVNIDKRDFSDYHEFEVIYDPYAKNFYYKTKEFEKSTICLMDIYTGHKIKKIHLEKIFAKNIQILNDKMYYLVKEKEWDDTSYLYQQNL